MHTFKQEFTDLYNMHLIVKFIQQNVNEYTNECREKKNASALRST
jgi:hypothetical protein